MKRWILFFSLVLCINVFDASSQEWAPDGAEWYYDYENFWYTGYVHIIVVGDTVIHDTICKVLSRTAVIHDLINGTTNTYEQGQSYMFGDEDRVYLFENDKFYVLYDFSALPGDTLVIPQNSALPQVGCDPEGMIIVSDTATVQVNGQAFRSISVTYTEDSHWAIYGDIYETIGPVHGYMLPEPNWCVIDLYEGGPLRCYSDPDFGLFSTGMAPECDYLVSVPELAKNNIKVYPNPCSGILHIDIPDRSDGLSIEMYNSIGYLVLNEYIYQSENSIDLSGLKPGLYTVRVKTEIEAFNRLIVLR